MSGLNPSSLRGDERIMKWARASTFLTSNLGSAVKTAACSDVVLTSSIVDGMLHHPMVVSINGESFRLKDKCKPGLLAASSKAAIHLTEQSDENPARAPLVGELSSVPRRKAGLLQPC